MRAHLWIIMMFSASDNVFLLLAGLVVSPKRFPSAHGWLQKPKQSLIRNIFMFMWTFFNRSAYPPTVATIGS